MDISKLFSLSYLFDPRPGTFSYMAFFVGFFLVIIIGSFYLDSWIKKHPKRRSLQHLLPGIAGHLRMLGLVGFIFLWVRYEKLPYLSLRFFFFLFLIYLLWVLGSSIHKYRTKLSDIVEKHTVKKTKSKYLPRQKKKKKKDRR